MVSEHSAEAFNCFVEAQFDAMKDARAEKQYSQLTSKQEDLILARGEE